MDLSATVVSPLVSPVGFEIEMVVLWGKSNEMSLHYWGLNLFFSAPLALRHVTGQNGFLP